MSGMMISMTSESSSPPVESTELTAATDGVDQVFKEVAIEANAAGLRTLAELSALLQTMSIHPEEVRTELFRNPNGVARKTADITSRHPDYQGETHERQRARCRGDERLPGPAGRDGGGGPAQQRARGQAADTPPQEPERDKGLRKRKIDTVLRQGRRLACEACGFDFEATHGPRGLDTLSATTSCPYTRPARGLHLASFTPSSRRMLAGARNRFPRKMSRAKHY
jgi:hypothetical protein